MGDSVCSHKTRLAPPVTRRAVTFAVVSRPPSKSEAKLFDPENEIQEPVCERKEDNPVKTSPPKFLQKLFD